MPWEQRVSSKPSEHLQGCGNWGRWPPPQACGSLLQVPSPRASACSPRRARPQACIASLCLGWRLGHTAVQPRAPGRAIRFACWAILGHPGPRNFPEPSCRSGRGGCQRWCGLPNLAKGNGWKEPVGRCVPGPAAHLTERQTCTRPRAQTPRERVHTRRHPHEAHTCGHTRKACTLGCTRARRAPSFGRQGAGPLGAVFHSHI